MCLFARHDTQLPLTQLRLALSICSNACSGNLVLHSRLFVTGVTRIAIALISRAIASICADIVHCTAAHSVVATATTSPTSHPSRQSGTLRNFQKHERALACDNPCLECTQNGTVLSGKVMHAAPSGITPSCATDSSSSSVVATVGFDSSARLEDSSAYPPRNEGDLGVAEHVP